MTMRIATDKKSGCCDKDASAMVNAPLTLHPMRNMPCSNVISRVKKPPTPTCTILDAYKDARTSPAIPICPGCT